MRIAAICFLILLPSLVIAQRFGGNPPTQKWMQLNTDTARIIFPVGLDSQASRIASLVHQLAAQTEVGINKLSLGSKTRKITIVLQNQTIIPNAYVGLGPYRSEFFLKPALNNFDQGTIPWNDQLALHEYRHVQQFNNFHTGISEVMSFLFGEQGYALAINASIPDWFFEGDAVYSETILTRQGRGRLPQFLNEFPVLWKEGKKYSWMKLRNGSLKDFVPDHYHLGYLLVNYGREKYGLDFWTKVTQDAAAFKGLFFPFQKAIKKYAGVDFKTFRDQAFAFYNNNLRNRELQIATSGKPVNVTAVTPTNSSVLTSYMFPYNISSDSLLYLKAANNKRAGFYIKDRSGEHLIRIRDISADQQYSYRNGKLVYAAYETDLRWSWRDYSVIKLLDVKTNKQYDVTSKTRYFTPDISLSGDRIAAVNISENGKSEIHILDARSGSVMTKLSSSEINLFTDPKFINETTIVCAVRLRDGKTALAIGDLNSGGLERLTAPSFNVVGYPAINDDQTAIYFTASYEGNDDVFAIKLKDKKIFRVTNGSAGNYFVNAGSGTITWSAFTAEGYQLQETTEDINRWPAINDSAIDKLATIFPVAHSEEIADVLMNPSNRSFPVTKYSKAKGLLNFHSWRPYYEDPEFSFSLYGQNVLNTTETEVYYLYNQNENTHAAGFNFTYGGLFPYLSAGTQYTFNRQRIIGNQLKQWDQLDTRVGFSIPLSWVEGRSFKQLGFGSSYVYRNDFNKGPNKNLFSNFNFSYLSHFISWSQQVQRAVQHFYPRFGYQLGLNHRHAITNFTSWQPLATASVFLPGALATHNVVITGAFQETDTLNTLFSNRFPYSRGYNEAYFARMWRVSGNYHFPIAYPDFGFANIFYLQRLRGNVFYDMTKIYSADKRSSADQRSTGAELFLDTKWWNQHPLTFGFRVSRLLDEDVFLNKKRTVFEFILPVSILPR